MPLADLYWLPYFTLKENEGLAWAERGIAIPGMYRGERYGVGRPRVIVFPRGVLRMYFALHPLHPGSEQFLATSQSLDGIHWSDPESVEPPLVADCLNVRTNSPPFWREAIIEDLAVIYRSDKKFRIFYEEKWSADGQFSAGGPHTLQRPLELLAATLSPENPFSIVRDNEAGFKRSPLDGDYASTPHAVWTGRAWRMYYVGALDCLPHKTRTQLSNDEGKVWKPEYPPSYEKTTTDGFRRGVGLAHTGVDPDVVHIDTGAFRMYYKGDDELIKCSDSTDGLQWIPGPLERKNGDWIRKEISITTPRGDTNSSGYRSKFPNGQIPYIERRYDPALVKIPSTGKVYMYFNRDGTIRYAESVS